MNTPKLSRRLAHCGSVSVFERLMPNGSPVYSVVEGGDVVQLDSWSAALIEFRRRVREQTERTLDKIK